MQSDEPVKPLLALTSTLRNVLVYVSDVHVVVSVGMLEVGQKLSHAGGSRS